MRWEIPLLSRGGGPLCLVFIYLQSYQFRSFSEGLGTRQQGMLFSPIGCRRSARPRLMPLKALTLIDSSDKGKRTVWWWLTCLVMKICRYEWSGATWELGFKRIVADATKVNEKKEGGLKSGERERGDLKHWGERFAQTLFYFLSKTIRFHNS